MMAFEPRQEIFSNVVCATSKASDQPAHTRSLIGAFTRKKRAYDISIRANVKRRLEYSMSVNLLTEHHLECLSLKGGCIGSSES